MVDLSKSGSKLESDRVGRVSLPPADVLELLELDADALKLIEPPSKRHQYRAVINWVTNYKCPQEVNEKLEVVKGYLEAFYHLCEVGDWERAKKILDIKVLPVDEYLDTQLRSWGYYEECIQLYGRLLGKLDKGWDGICLNRLGIAYSFLGEYHKAIEYFQQSLQIAREIGDLSTEGKALGNLGNVYDSLGEYHKAIEYHQQDLQIAREIGNRSGEGIALGNLGNVYNSLGEYHKAMEYYQQSLQIAREIGDLSTEGKALGSLGLAYYSLGEYHKAIEYLQQDLQIAREIGNRSGEAAALGSLGNVYDSLGEYHKAMEYYQQSLQIAREIGDLSTEGKALG
ncbi:tetratricopeptide repeat protein, partial [Dapis sp. BLCC M229]|uniref:tetratricopeptide repeat protein n=1 Tax=Dapis sp. BLCC M229 TaxID=3400188 RepID=UPI003CF9601B